MIPRQTPIVSFCTSESGDALSCLSAYQCVEWWSEIRYWLDRVPHHDEWDENHVRSQLKREKAQCWVTIAPDGQWLGIFITQIKKKFGRKWLLYWILAGKERERWVDFINVVDRWGKEQGCEFARTYGRRGWKKVLPDLKECYTVMQRNL